MKIRNGFVSNSSSSSFICDVCGEIESGMDAGLEDFEMFTCTNGHTFHGGCSKIKIPDGVLYPEGDESSDDFEEFDRYDTPIQYCPFCQFKTIDPDDAINYFLKKNGVTRAQLVKEIREKFKTYDEFITYKGEL